MSLLQSVGQKVNDPFYEVKALLDEKPNGPDHRMKYLTRKSLQLLKLLWENGNRKTVYSVAIKQADLASKLQVTRQALSIHFKRLRDFGLIQVGRGFVNVTEDGLNAIGYNTNPVIVFVRLSPQKRLEAFGKIKELTAVEIFRVTGDVDVVLVVEQDQLDFVLKSLTDIEGVIEARSLVSIETMK